MYIVQYGNYIFPSEQLELDETAGVSRRSATQALGGRGGSWDDIGDGPDPLAEDQVNKNLTLEGTDASDLQDQVDELIGSLMGHMGNRLLIALHPDGTTRRTWAKCMEVRARWEWFNINNGWLPVSITWKRTWPVWEMHQFDTDYSNAMYLLPIGVHLGTFEENGDLPFPHLMGYTGIRASTNSGGNPISLSVSNAGSYRVENLFFEFHGEVTNPKLRNKTNGHWFQYSGTLQTGDRLTVNCAPGIAKVNGANAWGSLTLGTSRGQMMPMVLEPGSNDLELTHEGTGTGWLFRAWWSETWL